MDVIASKHPESSGFDNLEDWVGTTIQFHIEPLIEGECKLHFTHKGLTQALECFDACNNGWIHYLNSLKDYAVDQEGEPYTDNSEDNIIR
ncbi:SRPBCC family protein [Pseudalkalibacillus berkeleyi]|uniref:SRPBCC domain-containing protein n=1 Tax=Pseudalkalibacillus berkeleyi TaxID=1069813 RepID=A0ABS9H139_9BACL|nr:SRPBCC domain-containing protein [Pseudalkalibacillus berkeleyi]MCF6137498.1 SRPBCC domain-containing protein [Pseudalkalibacillus berkeleyi]